MIKSRIGLVSALLFVALLLLLLSRFEASNSSSALRRLTI